jgi:hypothetical protein
MCWRTVPETSISAGRVATGVSAITVDGRSRRIWIDLRLARQPGSHIRDLIRNHVLQRDPNSSGTIVRASKAPNVLRISSARAVLDDAEVIAEAIRSTMYHRYLTFYENLDVI